MKRIVRVLVLLIALGGGALSAQTRVSVSLSFGAPFVAYHPRPYGYGYGYRHYVVYDPRPTIIVVRPYHRPAGLIVVRSHTRRHRRHYHDW